MSEISYVNIGNFLKQHSAGQKATSVGQIWIASLQTLSLMLNPNISMVK